MKINVWVLVFLVSLLAGCTSADNFKNYKSIKVLKNGTISLIDEIKGDTNLPLNYHKVYFDKNGKVKKEHHIVSGHVKISSMYIYDKDEKVKEVRHFDNNKYNGVSIYVYEGGVIVKEELYDRDMNFVFSKKFE